MSCAHHDGWFGVAMEWKAGDYHDLELLEFRIVGRCNIYAPFFDSATPCAEGLIVEHEEGRRYALYWSKPDRVFRLVPLRAAP